jgi:hypothetical protein
MFISPLCPIYFLLRKKINAMFIKCIWRNTTLPKTTYVTIPEIESIVVSMYPAIVFSAFLSDVEPEMIKLIPTTKKQGLDAEKQRKRLLFHLKKTEPLRDELIFKYNMSIEIASLCLDSITHPETKMLGMDDVEMDVMGKHELLQRQIRNLSRKIEDTECKTVEQSRYKQELQARLAKLTVLSDIQFNTLKENNYLDTLYEESRKNADRTHSGADILTAQATGMVLGYKKKDAISLGNAILQAVQTRDVIELGLWKLLECINVAIEQKWENNPQRIVPKVVMPTQIMGLSKNKIKETLRAANVVMALQGTVGTGKSRVMEYISNDLNLDLASFSVPNLHSAFFGVPVPDSARGVVTILPTEEGMRLTEHPAVVNLDELLRTGNAGEDMQNRLLKLILEREIVPGKHLHPLSMVTVTTNPPGSSSNPGSIREWNEALANRMRHFTTELTFPMVRQWISWLKNTFDIQKGSREESILLFLESRLYDSKMQTFFNQPTGRDLRESPAFPTLRTWASAIGNCALYPDLSLEQYVAYILTPLIGEDMSEEYRAAVKATEFLPDIQMLLKKTHQFQTILMPGAMDAEPVWDNGAGKWVVRPLSPETMSRLNGCVHESFFDTEKHSTLQAKSLLNNVKRKDYIKILDRDEKTIRHDIEKSINSIWGDVFRDNTVATLSTVVANQIVAHVLHTLRESFENKKAANGVDIQNAFRLISLFPYSAGKDIIISRLEREILVSPDTVIEQGLKNYGIMYENNIHLKAKGTDFKNILYVFPALVTLEYFSERWRCIRGFPEEKVNVETCMSQGNKKIQDFSQKEVKNTETTVLDTGEQGEVTNDLFI